MAAAAPQGPSPLSRSSRESPPWRQVRLRRVRQWRRAISRRPWKIGWQLLLRDAGAVPPLPAAAQSKPVAKRPSAIVNKDAVARVQAAQAAMRAKSAQTQSGGFPPRTCRVWGRDLGDAVRTFRQAVADVRSSVDPQMRTIRAEMDSAKRSLEQSIEAAKQAPVVDEEAPAKPLSYCSVLPLGRDCGW